MHDCQHVIEISPEWLFTGVTSSNNDIARVGIAMGGNDRVTLDNVEFGTAQLAGGAA